ncbi:hypothetical protein DSECCO2_601720 [anaerobic digester metagenome]
MPDRDFAFLAKNVKNLETIGLADIFEVHSTKAVLNHFYKLNDFVRIILSVFSFAVNAKCDTIHATEVFHQICLAFHHAKAAGGSHIAIAQNARAVADDSHQVAAV